MTGRNVRLSNLLINSSSFLLKTSCVDEFYCLVLSERYYVTFAFGMSRLSVVCL